MKLKKSKKSTKFLNHLVLALLFFIFVDQAAETSLIKLSLRLQNSEMTVIYILFGLKALFATIQSGFSDFYCRKKSLIVAFLFTLISLVLLKFSNILGITPIIIAIMLKGIGGNIIPISRAGLADITLSNNFRFAIALSICGIALGSWGPIHLLNYITKSSLYFWVLLLVILGILLLLFRAFEDNKDKPPLRDQNYFVIPKKNLIKWSLLHTHKFLKLILKEYHQIFYNFLCKKKFLVALLSYCFAEISFYQIFFRSKILTDFFCFTNVPLDLGVGYLLGTVFLKFSNFRNRTNIILGVTYSTSTLFILSLISAQNINEKFFTSALFMLFSLGYAIFIPSLFSSLSHKRTSHVQGKIYGLIESTDTIASLISFGLVLCLKEISCSMILIISTGIFIISALLFHYLLKIDEISYEY